MPYKDKEKVRQYQRDWVRRKRAQGSTNNVTPFNKLRSIFDIRQSDYKPIAESNPVPFYNPSIHRPGDRVLMHQGNRLIETVIPLLDADGNPIPD